MCMTRNPAKVEASTGARRSTLPKHNEKVSTCAKKVRRGTAPQLDSVLQKVGKLGNSLDRPRSQANSRRAGLGNKCPTYRLGKG